MLSFTPKEKALMRRLNTPAKVQEFLNSIPINFEKSGVETLKSPVMVLRTNSAHCIEAAMLGAYILSLHGYPPLLLHLEATRDDLDHVIAPFKKGGLWGALSKSNHAQLRYREPVYKSIRELVISYFHEYFTDSGTKTLRRYSRPLDMNTFESDWMLKEEDMWDVDEELDTIRHFDIAPKSVLKNLRKADPIECKTGKVIEWRK